MWLNFNCFSAPREAVAWNRAAIFSLPKRTGRCAPLSHPHGRLRDPGLHTHGPGYALAHTRSEHCHDFRLAVLHAPHSDNRSRCCGGFPDLQAEEIGQSVPKSSSSPPGVRRARNYLVRRGDAGIVRFGSLADAATIVRVESGSSRQADISRRVRRVRLVQEGDIAFCVLTVPLQIRGALCKSNSDRKIDRLRHRTGGA
jgi:hypothetical protein